MCTKSQKSSDGMLNLQHIINDYVAVDSNLHHSKPCHLFFPEHPTANPCALPEPGHPTLSKDVVAHTL